jgi:hypothetical protein
MEYLGTDLKLFLGLEALWNKGLVEMSYFFEK